MSQTAVKFSEDVVTLGELKVNPGKIVRQTQRTRRPVLVTVRGQGEAIVQPLETYETDQEEKEFMRAVVKGLADIEAGKTLTLNELSTRLGLA